MVTGVESLVRSPNRKTAAKHLMRLAARFYARVPARVETRRLADWRDLDDMVAHDRRVGERRFMLMQKQKTSHRGGRPIMVFMTDDEVSLQYVSCLFCAAFLSIHVPLFSVS